MLLILAGVTIKLILGDSGIFKQAQSLQQKQEEAMIKEKFELIKLNLEAEKAINKSISIEDFFEDLIEEDLISDPEIGGDNIQEIEPDEEENHRYEITTDDGHVIEIEIDGEGNIEIEYQGKVDGLPPRIRKIQTSSTTNSIYLIADVVRLDGGHLSYYYKKDEEPETSYITLKEGVTDLTTDFTNLEQDVIYNIKVVVTNENGSVEGVVNERTGKLAEGAISQVGNMEWNNGTATLRLETSETGTGIVYQIGDIDGEWLPYSEEGIGGLNHGDMVYAAISDGTNVSKESSFEIEDGIAPTVTITQGTITTKSITVNVSATDEEWGMTESPTYNYYIKKSTENSYLSTASYTGPNTSYIFDNLSQTTSYDIKVTTVDKAGNEGSKELTGVSTGTIGGATGNLTSGNIIASNPTWSNGTASITLSKGSGVSSAFSIQWQKNSISGSWITGTSVTGLNHNDTVYARLTDGRNAGSEASVTIKDSTAPTAATITLGSTSVNTGTTVTATVTHKDKQSGPNITSCRYIWNTSSTKLGTNASSYTGGAFSSNGQTISRNMSSKGTYYLHVLTVDKGGNALETVSSAITVKQLVTGITVSPTSTSLEVGDTKQLTATISPTTANNKSVTWSSSNTGVATVSSSGLVTANAVGNATITATATDGSGIKATCTIEVVGWTTDTNNSIASVTLRNPASTSSPTIMQINNSATPDVYAILTYQKKLQVGDQISIKYMYTRSNNYYYLDLLVNGAYTNGTMGTSAGLNPGNAGKTLTYTTTVEQARSNLEVRLVRSNVRATGYYVTLYIYEILINGEKVL